MAYSEDSPEYRTIIKACSCLTFAIQHTLFSLSSDLITTQLITPEIGTSLTNSSRGKTERALELVTLVTHKIKQNARNYHVFIEILTKNEIYYQEVLQQLSSIYSTLKTSTVAPGLPVTTASLATITTNTPKQIDISTITNETEGMSRYL